MKLIKQIFRSTILSPPPSHPKKGDLTFLHQYMQLEKTFLHFYVTVWPKLGITGVLKSKKGTMQYFEITSKLAPTPIKISLRRFMQFKSNLQ